MSDHEEDTRRRSWSVDSPRDRRPNKTPWLAICAVVSLLVASGCVSSSLYPYVAFMVVDTGQSKTLAGSGYWAGILASSYFFAQIFTSFAWGRLSDRFGRRPVMLSNTACAAIVVLLFGFTRTSFWWAVAMRFLTGFFNSTGVMKATVAELSDSTTQARALGLTGVAWGGGAIVGSVIGGVLSRPARQYPLLFSRDGLLGEYPYLLPNLFGAIVFALCFVSIWVLVPETRNKAVKISRRKRELRLMTSPAAQGNDDGSKSLLLSNVDARSEADLLSAHELESADENAARRFTTMSAGSGSASTWVPTQSTTVGGDDIATVAEPSEEELSEAAMRRVGPPSVFRSRDGMYACALYAVLGGVSVSGEEMMPLFLVLPERDGGLGFSPAKVGVYNLLGALFLLITQVTLWPVAARRFSYLFIIRCAALIYAFYYFCHPLLPYLLGVPVVLWGALALLALLLGMLDNALYSSVFCIVSNSVPPYLLGETNGLGQTIVAVLRTLGPALAGSVFAGSLHIGIPFFPWTVLIAGFGVLSCMTLFASPDLQTPWVERHFPPGSK